VRVELREDTNTPPALYATDLRSKRAEKIYDPNPGFLDRYSLGRTEVVHWRDSSNRPWSGLLYYPIGYQPGHRYPLVIQTHGYLTGSFGFALAGGYPTAYAAQPLANRGIAVLCLRFPDRFEEEGLWEKYMNTPREPQTVMAGTVSAIEHLRKIGLVNPGRVGLVGFSRTGWYVEYILTHSDYPFAAAIAADGEHYSYGEYILSSNVQKKDMEKATGAPPFGPGLAAWLREAVGFNMDKIHTPLRLEEDSDYIWSVIGQWEIYGNMRRLERPVDYHFAPDLDIPDLYNGGSHPLVNPIQRLASQGGTVDWFDFWFNGREDASSAKSDQYRLWEKLCDMQAGQNPQRKTFCVRTKTPRPSIQGRLAVEK